MDLKKFAKVINECYCATFSTRIVTEVLPHGFVKASITKDGTLLLNIGDRSGEFNEDGVIVSCGINRGDAIKWRIIKHAQSLVTATKY